MIETRAKERHAREQAEHDARMAQRAAKTAASGKKPRGRIPQPPVEGPLPSDQVKLTDEQSRIMPVAGGGFEQCYNAQAIVAAGSLLVIATGVTQAPNDKRQLEPMLGKLADLPEALGEVGELRKQIPEPVFGSSSRCSGSASFCCAASTRCAASGAS